MHLRQGKEEMEGGSGGHQAEKHDIPIEIQAINYVANQIPSRIDDATSIAGSKVSQELPTRRRRQDMPHGTPLVELPHVLMLA